MWDEQAKLYFNFEGNRYRIKVFHSVISIERQPNGDNVLLAKADHGDAVRVYDPITERWDYGALFRLLKRYPYYDEGVLVPGTMPF